MATEITEIFGERKMPKTDSKRASLLIDRRVVQELESSGIDLVCSVPCGLLSGILEILSKSSKIEHVPVTREEEGVGICAGAYLGGARPALLMQNSGLGNCLNALLSLTNFYDLGLFLLIGFRGRRIEEEIEAQIPMGDTTMKLLSLAKAQYLIIESPKELGEIGSLAIHSYLEGRVCAALLTPKLFSSRVQK